MIPMRDPDAPTRNGPNFARAMWAFRAYIVYHARAYANEAREHESWLYLMEWARLGGKPEDGPWRLYRRATRGVKGNGNA